MQERAGAESQDPLAPWHLRYPDRWRREREELSRAGLRYRTRCRDGHLSLRVSYPVRLRPIGEEAQWSGTTLHLDVWFPALYPFFPPTVVLRKNLLGFRRHRNPVSGELCILHCGWTVGTTVAQLLSAQMPKVLAAELTSRWSVRRGGRMGGRREQPRVTATFRPASAAGLGEYGNFSNSTEMLVPVPATRSANYGGPVHLVPSSLPAADVDQGALSVQYAFDGDANNLGVGLVDRILGPGVDIECEAPDESWRSRFRVCAFGRWVRDDAWTPAEGARETWTRVTQRLRPLTVEADTRVAAGLPRDVLEVLALLVPDEIDLGVRGESWVFIVRLGGSAGSTGKRRYSYVRCDYQILSRSNLSHRVPIADRVDSRTVTLVGLGALGHHLAHDLGLIGAGLSVVDKDFVSVDTAGRQPSPPVWAGAAKASLIAEQIRGGNLFNAVEEFAMDVASAWEPARTDHEHDQRSRLRSHLLTDALVIDATGEPTVTRWLGAVRAAHGKAFMHVSATASVWGGIVFLSVPSASGCWACVERWRTEPALPSGAPIPVPKADPAGWANPPVCSDVVAQGTRPDFGLIAHHASRVAMNYLANDPDLGADYFVAALRGEREEPAPLRWTSVRVPPHPACPLHGITRASESRREQAGYRQGTRTAATRD